MHVAQDMLLTVPAAVLAPCSLLRLALRGADVRAAPSTRAPAVAQMVTEQRVEQPTTTPGATRTPTFVTGRATHRVRIRAQSADLAPRPRGARGGEKARAEKGPPRVMMRSRH